MKKVFKVQYLFYVLLLAAIVMIGFAVVYFRVDDRTISNSQVERLDGFKVTFSDGSKKEITLPNKITADAGDSIILSNRLTEDQAGMTLAFRTSNQSVIVRVDGRVLYEFGNDNQQMFGKSPGSLWHYVTLPDSFEKGALEIELCSPFKNIGGSVGEVLCGAKSSSILYFMQREWVGLLAGFALLLFGFLFMLYHIAMGHLKLRNTGMFHLGVASVLLAANMIISTGMVQIFYGNASVYYLAAYSCLYLCVIPFLLYLADTVFEMKKQQLHVCAWIFSLNFLVVFVLQLGNWVDFYQYIKVYHILLIVLMVYLFVLDITFFVRKEHNELHVLLFLLLLAEAVLELLDIFYQRYASLSFSRFGFLMAMLVLGSVNISKVVRDYRIDVDKRMEENEEKTQKLVEEHDERMNEIENLKGQRDYAEQYSMSKSLFLRSVSQKLVVPLSQILGMADLVLHDEINDNVKEKVLSVQTAGTTALTLTKNIVDYTSYETNSLELKCVAYPMEKLLYDMNESVSIGLIEKNVEFIADFSPNIPRELFGDEIRIRQILSTILANAVRYTQEGSIRFHVDAEIQKADEILLNISISDSGTGIKEENLADLFDMFLLYKTEAEVAGTGLGLAVCKKLIDLMDGEIRVESKFGEGTTFYLQIPQKIINGMPIVEVAKRDFKTLVYEDKLLQKMMLKKVFLDLGLEAEFVSNDEEFISKLDSGIYHTVLICHKEYLEHQEYLEQPLNAPIRKVVMADVKNTITSYENADILQRPIQCMNLYDAISGNDIMEPIAADPVDPFVAPQANILVVDDNPANLKIMLGLLERYRMNVQTAISGAAGLEMLRESRDYDLVFLDYSMTGMSGVETLHTLREYSDKYYKTLPVIAMTVHMVKGARELFVEEGFDDYIPKPVEQGRLHAVLEEFLPEDKVIRNDGGIQEDAGDEEGVQVQDHTENGIVNVKDEQDEQADFEAGQNTPADRDVFVNKDN